MASDSADTRSVGSDDRNEVDVTFEDAMDSLLGTPGEPSGQRRSWSNGSQGE